MDSRVLARLTVCLIVLNEKFHPTHEKSLASDTQEAMRWRLPSLLSRRV